MAVGPPGAYHLTEMPRLAGGFPNESSGYRCHCRALRDLSGCASIVGGGTSQDISVMTSPPGATCVFYRQGDPIGTVQTPGNLTVKRRKYDITIKCNKQGYDEASYLNHSGLSDMVAANVAADLIVTAGISSIVDSADGADNDYTSSVVIGLNPSLTATAAVTSASQARGSPIQASLSSKACTHEQQVQARIARENGYTGGPRCD
jgi:hypothetical protein